MEIDEKLLDSLFKEADAFPEAGLDLYYAGLAVLVGDMCRNLPRLPSELFNYVASLVATKDYAFPYFDPRYSNMLPGGMAANAAAGQPSIKHLGRLDIIHEWTVEPGQALFNGFNGRLKESICKGKDCSYNKYIEKRLLTQADLQKDVAITVLKTNFSADPVWYPTAVYITQIIVKTPIEKYCEF